VGGRWRLLSQKVEAKKLSAGGKSVTEALLLRGRDAPGALAVNFQES